MSDIDPISAYLFILVSEVVFAVIKSNKKINGVKIFEYEYLYTAYRDDTTFFSEKPKIYYRNFKRSW